MEHYKTWLLSAKGRNTRTQFWLGLLLGVAIIIVGSLIFVGFTTVSNSQGLMYVLLVPYIILIALIFWSQIALTIKRLHDLDFSGWWTIPTYIVPFAIFVVGLMPAKPGPNQYGANPKEV